MNSLLVEPTESEILSEMTRQVGWDIFYDQLDRGLFKGSFEFSAGLNTQFMVERYNRSVCVHGAVPKGMATFIVALPLTDRVSFCGNEVTPGTICALMPGDEGALNVPRDQSFLTCCVDAEILDDSLGNLHCASLAERLACTGTIHTSAVSVTRLRSVIHRAVYGMSKAADVIDSDAADLATQREAIQVLCHALTAKESSRSTQLAVRNHWRCVRRAREFIESHLCSELRMEAVCRHTQVSERTLEAAFREVTGHSPSQFIKTRRLNVARHKLLTSLPGEYSVKQAALTSGFWHLGYFSRDYLAQFGELPSTTLARAHHRSHG